MVKNPPANARTVRDVGSIPGSERSPGGENGSYSSLENSMDRGAWQATVYRVAKSQTWLNDFSKSPSQLFTFQRLICGLHFSLSTHILCSLRISKYLEGKSPAKDPFSAGPLFCYSLYSRLSLANKAYLCQPGIGRCHKGKPVRECRIPVNASFLSRILTFHILAASIYYSAFRHILYFVSFYSLG